ncbi:polyphosphate kinase 1 [Aquimarina sp. W85]|uniref:polyphosphate kinase 1 n=1 Tax=Aquimarina rhodophyticola TaxID=3342246 RepID=UPI003670870E
MTDKYPYRHRDLNWLSFNERVLQEAEDVNNPLYERLKFLAIFSSNLDEYFRVRVSRLRQIKKIDKQIRKNLALKPNKQVKEILKRVKAQQERFGNIFYRELIPQLAENNIYLVSDKKFDFNQSAYATEFFIRKILPHIESKIISPSNDTSLFLDNNLLYFVVVFKDSENLGIVNLPTQQIGRFVCFPSENDKSYITFIDDIIKSNITLLFEDEEISGCYEIKLSRDAELYIEDEFEGVLAEKIKASLNQRKDGQATRLLYDTGMPKNIKKKLKQVLGLGKIDMMPGGKYHNFSDFFSFPNPKNDTTLSFPELETIKHRAFESTKDYFEVIANEDQMVHFPYMSFNYVQNFINQAAIDPNVTQIQISLYRVADESALTTALLTALDNGKKVTVFVEAKARFDEENNLKWGKKFEDKGANVYYSYPKIKVHSKILLVKRKEDGKSVKYAYIGTGNFNAKTSKIYCDHGLFTANPKITKDLSQVFKILSGKLLIPTPKHLLISPFNTRATFENLIDQEIINAKNGKSSGIKAKLNSLEDKQIINKLYDASNAGVTIELLVRGFSCLVPGLEEISENITITSVLDRFLEHGRIYLFNANNTMQLYMGSADWMTRNLDNRIEVLTPIYNTKLKEELKTILNLQLNDNVKARYQDAEETNTYTEQVKGDKSIRSQYEIIRYLSKVHAT